MGYASRWRFGRQSDVQRERVLRRRLGSPVNSAHVIVQKSSTSRPSKENLNKKNKSNEYSWQANQEKWKSYEGRRPIQRTRRITNQLFGLEQQRHARTGISGVISLCHWHTEIRPCSHSIVQWARRKSTTNLKVERYNRRIDYAL